MKVHEKKIEVQLIHLDELQHVNNVQYLQWIQDVSKEHWLAEVDQKVLEKYYWVVRGHHIEYKKQAFLGDIIIARTYVASYKGPFSERVVQFYKDETLLVEAKSNWCLINFKEQKPSRVPEEIKQLFEEE